MPGMQDRIDAERDRLERERQQREQDEQARIAREKEEDEEYIARAEADDLYLAIVSAANHPLLIEALQAYFEHFPVVESKEVLKRSFWGSQRVRGPVARRFKHAVAASAYATSAGRPIKYERPSDGACVHVNGITIRFDRQRVTSTFRLGSYTESTAYGEVDGYQELLSVDEVADYIAKCIVENKPIAGLYVDQASKYR